jgi:hypothetical protein
MVKTHFVSLNANQVTTIDNQSWIAIQACDANMLKKKVNPLHISMCW